MAEHIQINDGEVLMETFEFDPLTGERRMRRFICRCQRDDENHQIALPLCHCADIDVRPVE